MAFRRILLSPVLALQIRRLKRQNSAAQKPRCNAASHAESGPFGRQERDVNRRPAPLAVRLPKEHSKVYGSNWAARFQRRFILCIC